MLTPTHTLSLFVFHRQPSDPYNIVTAQFYTVSDSVSLSFSLTN